tara:strand:+ start:226 stop:645 length:420 start_codon:yes stop_codon:yes gene_type:complete
MSIMNPSANTAADVASNLKKLGAAGAQMVEQALYQRGQELMRKMKPLTPLRDGALRRSAYAGLPERKGREVVVEVGFDGASAPYALFVHEMPVETNWTEPGTGPKFLEGPFDEMSKTVASDMANSIAAMLRRNRVPKGY